MSKIFCSLNEFSPQSKKQWIERFLNEGRNNKLEEIQHIIRNETFDPIYFNEEIKEKNTFLKKKGWKICSDIIVRKIKTGNERMEGRFFFGIPRFYYEKIERN